MRGLFAALVLMLAMALSIGTGAYAATHCQDPASSATAHHTHAMNAMAYVTPDGAHESGASHGPVCKHPCMATVGPLPVGPALIADLGGGVSGSTLPMLGPSAPTDRPEHPPKPLV